MNQFSVVMLVSRDDAKFERAVDSVANQEPDEFRAYVDTTRINGDSEHHVRSVLKEVNAKIYMQNPKYSSIPHENIVHNYHHAMLEAKHKWVIKMDDDDELIGTQRRQLLDEYGGDKVGIIHGDKLVNYPYFGYLKTHEFRLFLKSLGKSPYMKGSAPTDYHDVRHKIWGGTAIINHKAFEQAHPLLDHSYFYDYKTFYWILRLGWKSIYVSEVLFIQNLPTKIDAERRSHWGTWPNEMERLDKIKFNG